MKRILNKGTGNGSQATKYEVTGTRKVIEQVGFTKDSSSGGLRLALGVKNNNGSKKTGYLKDAGDLCVITITGNDRDNERGRGKLDLVVGFYKKSWSGNTPIKVESNDKLESGYGDWCERRAPRFEKEKNLIVGISFDKKVTGKGKGRKQEGGQVSNVTYKVGKDSVGFIGAVRGDNKDYNRVCATKLGENNCSDGVYPVVLGIIGNKGVGNGRFEESSPVEGFSGVYWALKTEPKHESVRLKMTQSKESKINIPVGVKFEDSYLY